MDGIESGFSYSIIWYIIKANYPFITIDINRSRTQIIVKIIKIKGKYYSNIYNCGL